MPMGILVQFCNSFFSSKRPSINDGVFVENCVTIHILNRYANLVYDVEDGVTNSSKAVRRIRKLLIPIHSTQT